MGGLEVRNLLEEGNRFIKWMSCVSKIVQKQRRQNVFMTLTSWMELCCARVKSTLLAPGPSSRPPDGQLRWCRPEKHLDGQILGYWFCCGSDDTLDSYWTQRNWSSQISLKSLLLVCKDRQTKWLPIKFVSTSCKFIYIGWSLLQVWLIPWWSPSIILIKNV